MRTLRRIPRLAKALATDKRVPRFARPLIVLGLLPWPGPVDEVVLVVALAIVALMRPGLLITLWHESEGRGA